jgi:ribosomal protein S18 acetylase RimI-like enzyme
MDIAYFKRFRMEIRLAGRELALPPTPGHYHFLPWNGSLLDAFARAKYLSFRGEVDAEVFPCLSEFDGCRRLMAEIAAKPGFLPEATWLVVGCCPAKWGSPILADTKVGTVLTQARLEYCGTVQGIRTRPGYGAIQNLGVAKEHRRGGLGMNLLLRALAGFREAGVDCVSLDVTAQNQNAIRLYRRVGFQPVRVLYKAVEPEYA